MKINDLLRNNLNNTIFRVLYINDDMVLTIDCTNKTMPQWMSDSELQPLEPMSEEVFLRTVDPLPVEDELSAEDRMVMHKRFTMIAPVLSFLSDDSMRIEMIHRVAEQNGVSKQTVRKYLCLYLIHQNIVALAPVHKHHEKELSPDEKNFRWALNKYYYTQRKHNLTTAYTMMLKAKYTDVNGQLMQDYPPFHRFKYYYYKHRNTQRELISRNGLTNYQRNDRPLLGTIQDFANAVGVGLLDATVCDIYLINESGQIVGRPILTLCVDAYSSLVCGYHLSWEGGVFSLNGLLQNAIADKVDWCKRFGICIDTHAWPCSSLPGVLVTDRGREYVGQTFEQITELGVKLINLPAYRPELKGIVEGAFHNIQSLYKPHLKGKGVIEPDFQERGSHDYRKDACLTMDEFEKVLLHCIIYYNSKRALEGFPYTTAMIDAKVQPYASSVWEWSCTQADTNLIAVSPEQVRLSLLPRTTGRFTRKGLIVNKQRYRHCDGNYTECYLTGGDAIVAYNPDDVSCVWLVENGQYKPFEIILQIYESLSLDEVLRMQKQQREIRTSERFHTTQALVDLAGQIETITNGCVRPDKVSTKNIRNTHTSEKKKRRLKGDVA